ncbi:MAG TPA: cytochrome c oxidase subunit 3 [Gammaproteobacteria bacterium]|nr:cytochrome c oxidase subunit 3 [Gammaproteobacteria bacterium]
MVAAQDAYFLPHGTKWPILGSIGLFLLLAGFALKLNGSSIGGMTMIIGVLVVAAMMFLWFGQVIGESESGTYNKQVDHSFRWGMGWFIFSEVMFFAAFFGALFYARVYAVPWLGGEGAGGVATNPVLWPNFEAVWPTNGPGDVGGAFEAMPAWGVPALNTIILLSSGVTVTFAHWAILRSRRPQFVLWLLATVGLGFLFVGLQAYEYVHAYSEMNLKLSTGVYGSTFFMLTGFHGAHVTIGAIMLTIMMLRGLKGHFTADHHFGFEAAAWYWHFVDVVWLGLFIFVYWL